MSLGPQDALPQTCEAHRLPLVHVGVCTQGCAIDFAAALPQSPLSESDQVAIIRHEMVMSHVRHGFSRSEAMQVLCTIISASVMKGSGGSG